ncbi:heme exporter protein CcmD [Vibrio mangrovi]|uniref:Heme exporter protein D n=1 Tax=Vibrio mangrovi TaxID=474394 RepID=A0A1Y6ISA6_9VIBR|nr:heme exporter protein CcmD [Vibrio mangrovi]MDW6001444.1 heme exporter protein CcmD [Vibrio mangrovi]SMS00534.1 Heme exporter protein D (CcmD) [Vibrio mangrovi]
MYFDSFQALLSMGGYAGYVWSAFGITFGMMMVLLWGSLRRRKHILREVSDRIARQARIDAAKAMENTL